MMNNLRAIAFVMALLGIGYAHANDIYVEQSGNSSTIDITQQGIGNFIGDSTDSVYIGGGSNTFTIEQIGDSNILAMVVNGSAAQGTLSYTGSDNTVEVNCGTTVSAGCSGSTINHTVIGDTNSITQNLGAGANHTTNVTVTGSDNTLLHTSSATGATTMNATVTGDLNNLSVSQAGTTTQTVNINASGNSNTISVTQSN